MISVYLLLDFDNTSISPKYSLNYPYLLGYFFLPTHARFFPWAGKNKSGSGTEKMKANLMKF